MKLTDWYPEDVRPVRPGFYEARYYFADNCPVRRYFDGNRWVHPLNGQPLLFGARQVQHGAWRGLAEDPNLPPSEPTHV